MPPLQCRAHVPVWSEVLPMCHGGHLLSTFPLVRPLLTQKQRLWKAARGLLSTLHIFPEQTQNALEDSFLFCFFETVYYLVQVSFELYVLDCLCGHAHSCHVPKGSLSCPCPGIRKVPTESTAVANLCHMCHSQLLLKAVKGLTPLP